MTITEVKKISEDEANKRSNYLIDLNNYLNDYQSCGLRRFYIKALHPKQQCGGLRKLGYLKKVQDNDKAISSMDEKIKRLRAKKNQHRQKDCRH